LLGDLFTDVSLVPDLLDDVKVGSLLFIVEVILEVLAPRIGFPDFYWYHGFRPVGEPKRGLMVKV